ESLIVVEDRPFEERNHAGDRASTRYDRLRARAAITSSPRLLGTIEDVLETGPRVEPPATRSTE
ncbi:MAG: ABC transporter, partial [Halobacteriales archaeon]